jgi:hypothetical protein
VSGSPDPLVPHSQALHQITVYTLQRKPFLEGDLRAATEIGLKNLATRFPGLRMVEQAIHPDRVEMLVDFQRLDEDVLRVVQSLKAEVKTLARKKGFSGESLWQWQYEDQWLPPAGG